MISGKFSVVRHTNIFQNDYEKVPKLMMPSDVVSNKNWPNRAKYATQTRMQMTIAAESFMFYKTSKKKSYCERKHVTIISGRNMSAM